MVSYFLWISSFFKERGSDYFVGFFQCWTSDELGFCSIFKKDLVIILQIFFLLTQTNSMSLEYANHCTVCWATLENLASSQEALVQRFT